MLPRSGGILLPVSSLPSPHGIGTFGRAAYEFADFLHAAGQQYWQILPLGPTGYGDSPYQSFSTFAGNPYLIDLDLLAEDGLLTREEIARCDGADDGRSVDYGRLYQVRLPLLALAKERGWARDRKAVAEFVESEKSWLRDYALFMALKRRFSMKPWQDWPDEALRAHRADALVRAEKELQSEVELFSYVQFLFFRQWAALKAYCNRLGIRIIGDLPIYVALDSADVWAEREMFRLDRRGIPTEVAGVPPDYFSRDGQLWGNPLYDYDAMRRDGFGWWIRRTDGAGKLYDVIRIDHFRGFERYWAVPCGAESARSGHWCKGPGMELLGVLTGWFPQLSFIAEDLGAPSEGLKQLVKDSGLPGMKVLEFAFDPEQLSDYLPHAFGENCVCYTGTHDNPPLAAWLESAGEDEHEFARRYLGLNREEGEVWGVLRGGMASRARLFIAQMQDFLALGSDSRINTPGQSNGNWTWRMLPGEASSALAAKLHEMTARYGRLPQGPSL